MQLTTEQLPDGIERTTLAGRLVLAGLQPLVAEVLNVAGIDSFIPVYADVQSACAGLKGTARDT